MWLCGTTSRISGIVSPLILFSKVCWNLDRDVVLEQLYTWDANRWVDAKRRFLHITEFVFLQMRNDEKTVADINVPCGLTGLKNLWLLFWSARGLLRFLVHSPEYCVHMYTISLHRLKRRRRSHLQPQRWSAARPVHNKFLLRHCCEPVHPPTPLCEQPSKCWGCVHTCTSMPFSLITVYSGPQTKGSSWTEKQQVSNVEVQFKTN